MKKSYCPYCGKQFEYLGLASHRSACAKRKTIKQQVDELEALWRSKNCRNCDNGLKPYLLDEDGTLVSITSKPGKLQHAQDIFTARCDREKGKHLRPIGEVEAKAYIRIWGADE